MTRVAIIAPPYPLEEAPSPPLGVSYIAAAFEAAGAQVRILDYIVSRYTREKLRSELEAFGPDAVGVGSVTMTFPVAVEIIRHVKEINPSIVTMMGGPHITFDAENTLKKHPYIDLLVLGEGEETVMELTFHLRDRAAWQEIEGIAFIEEGKTVMTRPRAFIEDLDALPRPARHLLPVSRYLALGYPVSIITSRGCPNRCIFCLGRRMVGHQVRYRDPVKIVDEMEEIISYGFPRINIADDLFLSKKERARALCREIIRRRLSIPWSAFSRVNTVDPDTLHLMRDAGCDTLSFGMESGNPEMLKRIRKGITLDQGRKAVKMCKGAGIVAHASFVAGLPGETLETLRETQEFAESLEILYGYHILTPFPGTTVREEIDRYDLHILTEDWALYDANRAVARTSALSQEEIERFVRAHDMKFRAYWEDVEKRYREGRATLEESFRVSGQHRTELTYRLLSEDIIENHGRFPLEDSVSRPGEETLLADKIAEVTGLERDLIARTLRDFIHRGYLRATSTDGHLRWHWTHNLSVSGPSPESSPARSS